jgi:hypothetical protein
MSVLAVAAKYVLIAWKAFRRLTPFCPPVRGRR